MLKKGANGLMVRHQLESWIPVEYDDTGQPLYYCNAYTGELVWTIPPASIEPEEAGKQEWRCEDCGSFNTTDSCCYLCGADRDVVAAAAPWRGPAL